MNEAVMKKTGRRNFLMLLGVGSIGAVASVAGFGRTRKQVAEPDSQGVASAGKSGYRLSEHVRKYYHTTRV
jgi:hypothetical protein